VKIAVSFASVKHKTKFFGKKCVILQEECGAALIYDGIIGVCNHHSHTKILHSDTKEKP